MDGRGIVCVKINFLATSHRSKICATENRQTTVFDLNHPKKSLFTPENNAIGRW